MQFQTDSILQALQGPLNLIEDPARRETVERFLETARFPLDRAVFDLLAALVNAVDAQVNEHYTLRLSYIPGGLDLAVEPKPVAASEPAAEPEWTFTDGEMEKVTIRIPVELKDLAMQAAAGAGISANSWFIRALGRSLRAMAMEEAQRHVHERHGPRHGPFGGPPPMSPVVPPVNQDRHEKGKRLQGWIGGA